MSEKTRELNLAVDVGRSMRKSAKLTRRKRMKILEVYAQSFNLSKAAREVGVQRNSIVCLLERDDKFRAAFEAIKEAAMDQVEEVSIDIAVNEGVKGFNDRRLLLEAHRPDLYNKKHIQSDVNIRVTLDNAPNLLQDILDGIPTQAIKHLPDSDFKVLDEPSD